MAVRILTISCIFALCCSIAHADDEAPKKEKSPFPDPGGAKLAEDYDIWLDKMGKRVIVDGVVCLREGQLEMFACLMGTKEHESIVALNAKAQLVHAALLAAGAKPGSVATWRPEYIPASGDIVSIEMQWFEKGELKKTPAQNWVRNTRTEKAMKYDWVFAGSSFWKDPRTGKTHYQAEGGDFICVSNFPTATLDLPVLSPQENSDLLFEAFTENIPPMKTPVRLVMTYRSPPPRPKIKMNDIDPKGKPKIELPPADKDPFGTPAKEDADKGGTADSE